MSTIVVGVDGSDESKKALRWAAEEAALRGADLKVVYAYEHEPSWSMYGLPYEATPPGNVDRLQERVERDAAEAQQHAETLLDALVADVVGSDVRVHRVALRDHHPADALVRESENADMLVVGSRGRGGFKGLVLGSVSQQAAHHATVPVTIIRADG